MATLAPAASRAQTFSSIPTLAFSMTFGGGNPLPQVITATSTGANFAFTATATTTTGGSWLVISPSAANYGCCTSTPYAITVSAAPATGLAAGTYSGQVVLKSVSDSNTLTIPVTLVVHATTATYFDQAAGGLTFTLQTSGDTPPAQALQIRNAGAGSLAWTAGTSTADGGEWLAISSASGTAPSTPSVTIKLANLPGLGLTAGTFTGQVLLETSGDKVSIPITVVVGDSVFRQINPLNFVKAYGGANPLAQVLTIASTGTNFTFSVVAQNSTGGSWLQISPTAANYGCCTATPFAVTVSVNPAVTLAAGTYSAEVIVQQLGNDGNSIALSIPVTMVVQPTTTAFLDNTAGALDFSMETSGDTPPSQTLQVRNAGTGTLTWTASASDADGGGWLNLSATSGTAPSSFSVSVTPANLPGKGLVAGVYVGQVVIVSATGRTTVPISVVVGASVFRQVNPLSFTKVYGGANPLSQVINIASTGTNFAFHAVTVDSTGGSWLQINPTAANYGCCTSTPFAITVSVNPSVTLAAGTYSAEVVVESNSDDGNTAAVTIPVTLTIEAATVPFFDAMPGEFAFSMVTSGKTPPSQELPIRNAGTGTLNWNSSLSTSDGGAWLAISSSSGTAPSTPSVSIIPANLPGAGKIAGTYTGQVVLNGSGDRVTIPVTVEVGASDFRQVNPLNFTKVYGGANPLPQVVTIASTGTNFAFTAVVANSTGGSWLQITPSAANYGCCTGTPLALTITANPTVTLAAGTYSAEVIVESVGNAVSETIPVTLTIEPATSTFFDTLPGQLTFSMATGAKNPPSQPLEIRNAGAGTLSWTASTSTSDGDAWLTISASSGTAPAVPTVSVNPANLPGAGLTPGTFTGQVVLSTSGDRVTIPVTMVVSAAAFTQINALDFNKVYGGANPLPQVFTVSSTGAAFAFNATAVNSSGGNWLKITPSSYGCCTPTPQSVTVSVNPDLSLAAGTYTGEIIVESVGDDGDTMSMTVPVTLNISAATVTFFDDLPGGISFFQPTSGANPASQSVKIRNAGVGTLNWTATASSAEGTGWLSVSAASGTAPSTLSISVKSANLPGGGLTAGTFSGTVVLVTAGDRLTIPVTVVVGANVFKSPAPLSFSMAFDGSNPASQVLSLASAGTNFAFAGVAYNATGGSWLKITPSSYGCCTVTPLSVTASVAPATPLAIGSYVAEIVFTSIAGDQGMIVPVTLTVTSTTDTAAPTFTPGAGTYDAQQTVTILDSTRGAAIHYTIDGTTPTTSSTVYSVPILVSATETIKAIAIAPGQPQSAMASALYTITAPVTGTPAVSQTITITEATSGATVYYTIDGTTPTSSSNKYTGPITITSSETLKFVAIAPGDTQSAVRTVTDTIQ